MESPVINKSDLPLQSKPKKKGYIIGRIYAVLVGLLLLDNLHFMTKTIESSSSALISGNRDAYTIWYAIGNITYVVFMQVFFVFAAFAIFRKSKHTLGIIYTVATLYGLGVLIRGLIPIQIGFYLVFFIPAIIYFRRRKGLFKVI